MTIEDYEAHAMAFYDETGIWPPGKSAPMEMYHELSFEERSAAWDVWLKRPKEECSVCQRNVAGGL